MKSVDEYMEVYREAAQQMVESEDVLAVGVLGLPGSMKGALVSQASPLAGFLVRRNGRKKAPGFPVNVVMAVTPTRLISFDFKPRGFKIRLTRRVATWRRSDVFVRLGDRGLQQQVFFHHADGTLIELEGRRSVGQYDRLNDAFFAELGLPGARPASRTA